MSIGSWLISKAKRKSGLKELPPLEPLGEYKGPQNVYSASPLNGRDSDIDLIISKIDLVNARLENLNQRLANIERWIYSYEQNNRY